MMRARILQADWDALRADRKAKAAVTVAANAETAKAAKAEAQAKKVSLGNEDFLAKARRVEANLNPKVAEEDAEFSYDDLTKAELVELLEERELPHSGNKDELIARLTESDAESDTE